MHKKVNRHNLFNQAKIIGIIVAIIVLLFTAILSRQQNDQFKSKLRLNISNKLSQIKAKIESEISRHFYLTNGLFSYISHNPNLDQETYKAMSAAILRYGHYIKRIELAPDNIVTYIYPLNGNENILGMDYEKNRQQGLTLKTLIDERKTIFDGPILDASGEKVFINTTPIYVAEAKDVKGKYWGLAHTVLDFDKFFKGVGLNDTEDSMHITLKKHTDIDSENSIIYGDKLHQSNPINLSVNVPGGFWILSGQPKMGWFMASQNQFITWVIGLSLALITGWLVKIWLDRVRKRNLQLETALSYAHSADIAKSDFVANMSHEIRTPLNPIISLTYLALKDDVPKQTRNYLKEIQTSAQLLLKIIDSVLDFSKIKADILAIEKLPFSLDQLLINFTHLYADQAQEKELSFNAQISQDVPPYVVGDATRLGQVLGNLLNNAIKFTREGDISLSVDVINQVGNQVNVLFEIQDSGIGMTPEQFQQLFQEFNQSDSSITREFGGTGLGLSICRKLIHLMGGEISAESIPEKGSLFSFNLPFDLASETMISEINAKSSIQTQQVPTYHGESVLLVEDNITNQMVVQKLLEGTGLRIFIANNGQEAVFMSLARRYDIILMDIQMPVMDGYKAAETIRQKKRYANVPIIAMTAHALEGDRKKSMTAGMSDHLSKPIDPDLFYQTLMQWLPAKDNVTTSAIEAKDNLWSLDELPGIDTSVGLKKFLQDQELYRKVLHHFHQDHLKDAVIIKQSLQSNDLNKAKSMAHTIKGAAAHLGANKLYKATVQLETDLKNEETQSDSFYEFQLALDEVLSGIAHLEDINKHKTVNIKGKNTIDKTELTVIINELSDKLNQASPQASELIPQLFLVMGPEHEEVIEALRVKIDAFDFEEALNTLNQLQNNVV